MNKRSRSKYILWLVLAALVMCALSATAYMYHINNKYTIIGSETERSLDNMTERGIESLDLTESGLSDLKGIERCESLNEITLGSGVGDISAIYDVSTLKKINALDYPLTTEQRDAIAESLPECEVLWNVAVGGRTVRSDVESLTLNDVSASDCANFRYLDKLAYVDLDGCVIDDDMVGLSREYPDCDFHWTIEYEGETIDSLTESLDYNDCKNVDVQRLTDALSKLPNIKKVELCDSNLKNEQLETLVAAFPEVKFVWRIYLGYWSLRTDATNFSAGHMSPMNKHISSNEAQQLKYCTDLVALDLGHNPVSDMSFVSSLPKLRTLIMVDCGITDISPIVNLKNLEYVELFQNEITDLTPLAELENIKEINIAKNLFSDASVLYDMKHLERVWVGKTNLSAEKRKELAANVPEGCEVSWHTGKYEDPCLDWRPIDYRTWGFKYDLPLNNGMWEKQEGFAPYNRSHANIDPDAYGDE